jgi:FixJ family two-component response regulator
MDRHPAGQESRAEIFVLEDDRGIRDMLSFVLEKAGYEVVCFADSSAFLATARRRVPACILLDVFLPGKSGIELLRELTAESYPAPVIMMSGRGDIAIAVSAMKLGAFDFIEKPFQGDELVARIRLALQSHAERQSQERRAVLGALHLAGAEPLSRREREVLEQFVTGASTKEVARTLGISHRTVEDHSLQIRRKLGAKNHADLVRIVLRNAHRPS